MKDRYCATLFIRNADNSRYAQLKLDLSNDFGKGRNEYPKTLADTHALLLTTKPPTTPKTPSTPSTSTPRPPPPRSDSGRNGGRRHGRSARNLRRPMPLANCIASLVVLGTSGSSHHFAITTFSTAHSLWMMHNVPNLFTART